MSYNKLGKYIKLIDNRNKDLSDAPLLGVSVQKRFITSIANTIGSDMSKYKLIEKNNFVYIADTSRRGDKIGIALLKDFDKAMISQAYTSFKIIDENELSPDYLMMWFSRPEFDRYARYHSIGSVRETFDWADMCEVELPIPSLEEQRQIVAQYQSIVNKIKVNEQICEKLEATAQALYKHWFVDFEFPNEERKPYKSSGGKMVWNEELGKEIPDGWELSKMSRIAKVKHGYAFKGDDFSELETENVLVSPGNFSIRGGFYFERNKYYSGKINKNYVLSEYDLVVNMTDLSKAGDTLGNTAIIPYISFKKLLHNQRVGLFEFEDKAYKFLIFLISQTKEYKHYILGTATGTTVRHTSPDRICDYTILLPEIGQLNKLNIKLEILIKRINLKHSLIYKLTQLQSLLLSRLAVGEEEKRKIMV